MPITPYNVQATFYHTWTRHPSWPNVEERSTVTELYKVRAGHVNVPDRDRRVRPSDLFLNQTPRFVESKHIQYNFCRHTTPGEPYILTDSGPSSYWGGEIEDPQVRPLVMSDFSTLDMKLRQKIKNQKADVLTACAEAPKLVDMIVDLAKDVVKVYGEMKRGRPGAAMRRALSDPRTRADRAVANRWLSYQFGLKPTMQDIYGLAEAVAVKAHEGFPYYVRTHSKRTTTYVVSAGIVYGDVTTTLLQRARARYYVRDPDKHLLGQLGALNPAAMVWELTPWSFVFDWLIDIGGWLEGFDALLGVSNLTVSRSYGWDQLFHQHLNIDSGRDAFMGYQKTRARLGVSDELSFGSPRIRGFATGSPGVRLANVGALISQNYRR